MSFSWHFYSFSPGPATCYSVGVVRLLLIVLPSGFIIYELVPSVLNTVDFQLAFAALPGSFLLLEPNAPQFTILAISDELLGLTAQSRPEVVGNSVFDVYPENPEAVTATGPSSLRVSLQNATRTKLPDRMPVVRYDVPNAEGIFEARYWSAHTKPVLNQAGEVQYLIHSTEDITAQVQAENRQRDLGKMEKSYSLFLQAPVGVYILMGPENVVELANDEMLRFLGATSAIVGQPLFQHLPPTVQAGLQETLDHVRKTGQPYYSTEYPIALRQDSEETLRYYNFVYQPYYDSPAAKTATGVFGVAHDVTEQVLAHQKLEESESRFRNMVKQAPIAITLTRGQDIVIESINDPMVRLLGKQSVAEVMGKAMVEVLPQLESEAILEIAKTVTETGQAFRGNEIPVKMLGDDGELEQRYYTISYTPLIEEAQVTGVVHVAIDVTEQVRARQKVEENSEELKRFKFMADQARDPFILMREDGSFAYLNNKALEAWGYTAEEAQHLRVPDVDADNNREGYTQLFAQAQRETIPQIETTHRHKSGQLFPVEVSLAGISLNEKPYLFAIARDITQQKNFREALRESEERFRIMADATPNLVWAVHPDSTIRYVNQAFVEFVGVSMEEYAATGWSAYLPEEELEFAQKTLTEAISNRTIYNMEHRMRRKDGEYRWLLAQGAPSYYPNGEIYGYVGSAIDITELKQANEQLVRINNDLDNFVYTASHDLKAPISNIEGLLHALLRTPATESMQSEQVQHILGLMQSSVERFTKTIANLTDIVKLQKVNSEDAELVNLTDVVQDVCLDLEPLRQSVGGRITLNVAACPAIHFSAKNLRSVIYNLLSNALKYSSPEREAQVLIQCEATAEYFVLTVQDNGLGIEAARIHQLFTMFQRFHDHVEGSGIGLYMVKKMVENAGGKIEVESEVGVGSTFRIYFSR